MQPLVRLAFALACAAPLAGHALYDPAPLPALTAVEGAWQGTLQYRDYQPPHKRVTLPTRVTVAAASPSELALHYVFNDGPAKTVHSYDRLLIDLDANLVRFSGAKPEDVSSAAIVNRKTVEGVLELVAERAEPARADKDGKSGMEVTRYQLRLGRDVFEVLKTAGPPGDEGEFRNEYVFRRER